MRDSWCGDAVGTESSKRFGERMNSVEFLSVVGGENGRRGKGMVV